MKNLTPDKWVALIRTNHKKLADWKLRNIGSLEKQAELARTQEERTAHWIPICTRPHWIIEINEELTDPYYFYPPRTAMTVQAFHHSLDSIGVTFYRFHEGGRWVRSA